MIIRFKEDVELDVIEDVRRKPTIENFKTNYVTEIDICDDLEIPDASEIQFGDGSVSFVTSEFWDAVEILEMS